MSEQEVEMSVRTYLEEKGWTLTNDPRLVGQHDWDIRAWHPKWRKIMLVEAKGDGKNDKYTHQTKHNAFYMMLGQIVARMDIKGNSVNCARTYALAIPAEWEKVYTAKIKNMTFGWNILKLNIFLVYEDGKVKKKTYTHFTKKKPV
ncbi:MAG: hypothetical protein ACSLEX_02625 [Minisyncoccota bacterium]